MLIFSKLMVSLIGYMRKSTKGQITIYKNSHKTEEGYFDASIHD
jgi:hypothetical protein